jgi:hypothetical protein
MTNKDKKIVAIAALITVALAVVVVVYILLKRIKNKERYLLVWNAEKDQLLWKGKYELDSAVTKFLIEYWKTVGVNFNAQQMQQSSTHSSYPWSAAYISNLVLRSGFLNFTPRTTHASYVIDAVENRKKKIKPAFWAFEPSSNLKVNIGDILVVNRGQNASLSTLNRSTPTHGDIVISFEKEKDIRYAIVQGGNVSNTVKTKRIKLNSDGTLMEPNKFIAHLIYVK